jgi:hypothetical protein
VEFEPFLGSAGKCRDYILKISACLSAYHSRSFYLIKHYITSAVDKVCIGGGAASWT